MQYVNLGKTGLKVASRSSAFRFKGRRDIDEQRIEQQQAVPREKGPAVTAPANPLHSGKPTHAMPSLAALM